MCRKPKSEINLDEIGVEVTGHELVDRSVSKSESGDKKIGGRLLMQLMQAFSVGLLLATSQTGMASVQQTLNYVYYPAAADGFSGLATILRRSTPIHSEGKEFFGDTVWRITWRFRWHYDADGSCRITESKTDVTGTITLPRLVNGTTSQVKEMDVFLAALRTHELGHFNIGIDAAGAIDRAILSLPTMRSCELLDSEANRVAKQILEEKRLTEKRYDATTEHGKLQGARLP
jgi:predicted secreted Zn-dependent protease